MVLKDWVILIFTIENVLSVLLEDILSIVRFYIVSKMLMVRISYKFKIDLKLIVVSVSSNRMKWEYGSRVRLPGSDEKCSARRNIGD